MRCRPQVSLYAVFWFFKLCSGSLSCVLVLATRPQLVWVVTCLASIFLGLDLGLAVGLGVELLTVVFRTQLYVHTSWFTLWLGLSVPYSMDQVRKV